MWLMPAGKKMYKMIKLLVAAKLEEKTFQDWIKTELKCWRQPAAYCEYQTDAEEAFQDQNVSGIKGAKGAAQ